jgi:hypothetical protein
MTSAALKATLDANAPLAALVSTRVYPNRGPQDAENETDYLIWTRLGTRPMPTHGEANDNESVLIQFSCFGDTYEDAEAIALALKDALDHVTLSTGDTGIYQGWRDAGVEPVVDLHRIDLTFLI